MYKLNSLPQNCMFFNRNTSQLNDFTSQIEKHLDPELGKKINMVYYIEEDRAFIVHMENGKAYLLEVNELSEADSSQVVRTRIGEGGRYFRVDQESGNWFEVPWDDVLYHCEPIYEYYKGKQSSETNNDLAKRVGERIRQLRTSKGLSIEKLADMAGMQRPNLSRLEHGKHRPSLDTIERLALALDVPVVDIVANTT